MEEARDDFMGSMLRQLAKVHRKRQEFADKSRLIESIMKTHRTDDERVEQLVEELCKSSVTIDTKNSGGSGVVILAGRQNLLLTCRHVIEPAIKSGRKKSLKIYNGEKTARAESIIAAPYGIDLALVEIDGVIGPAASMTFTRPRPGAGVMVIGAGMGIDNTVSMGIVSKIIAEKGRKGFGYEVFQTDAVVNPGNSGGGLFRSSSGELIGIITYKLKHGKSQLAEGGFGISTGTIAAIPKDEWKVVRLT